MTLRFVTLVFIGCAAVKTAAHDFWLEPSTFHPADARAVAIRLMVGDHGRGEPVKRNNRRIDRFVVRDADGEKDIPGRQGSDPAGYLDSVSGTAMVGYQTTPLRHGDMSAERFEAYLREEGLERIIGMRAAAGNSRKSGREIYSRSAKAWLSASRQGAGFDVPFGFRFEIVPSSDPATAGVFEAQVLFEGKPVEGVLVRAIDQSSGTLTSRRSNSEGRAQVRLEGDGPWIIKAVHMIPASSAGADWESIWATLTFGRGAEGRNVVQLKNRRRAIIASLSACVRNCPPTNRPPTVRRKRLQPLWVGTLLVPGNSHRGRFSVADTASSP